MSLTIECIHARQILDSRAQPTVEVDVTFSNGAMGRAAVPSGASTGTREAIELRDHDTHYYCGQGVRTAVSNVNDIIGKRLCGTAVVTQSELDAVLLEMDGTENKSRLGANALLGVSLSYAKALAVTQKKPLYESLIENQTEFVLPVPMMNILNGGAHADNNMDIQEFMVMPIGAPTFSESLRYGAEIFYALKSLLKKQSLVTAVGDEGGFAPNLKSNQAGCDVLMQAITDAGFKPGEEVVLALDLASSEFYEAGQYHLKSENKILSPQDWIDTLASWADQYPILSIEDAMSEDDWDGWRLLTNQLGNALQLVGDDLFVTNKRYLQEGIDTQAANAILIKVNQIGTLTETLETMALARKHGFACVMSHRSGETEDTTIADLAVATGCGQIKTGSLCRSDRVAKYNQLLRIEEALGDKAHFAGREIFAKFQK